MKLAQRGMLIGLAVGMLVLVVGCPTNGPVDPAGVLVQAAQRARLLAADAIVIAVTGVNGAALDGQGSQTLAWEFTAVDPNGDDVHYVITYDGATWADETVETPLVGVGYVDLTDAAMSETEARALLTTAGHGDDFFSWSLYQPLHPDFPNPLYSFAYEDKAVTLDTVTETVTVAALNLEAPPFTAPPGADSVSAFWVVKATDEVRDVHPDAFIVWAGGHDGTGAPLETANDTNAWDFTAVALDGDGVRTWGLHYDGEWTITPSEFPPFGIVYTDLTEVTMDVVAAWDLAVAAGYEPPFDSWSMFKPLHPGAENHVYVFSGAVGFIIVDTVTGEVTVE